VQVGISIMTDDIVLLILGAVIGFISAIALEFARHWLAQKRLKLEEKKSNQLKQQTQLTEFLGTNSEQKNPAWISVKQTPKAPLISFSKTEFAPTDLGSSDNTNQLRNLSNPNEKYIVTDLQIIGRDSQCEIRLSDKKISRKHAMIRYESGNYIIYDLGSANGVFVNGEQVLGSMGVVLNDGDIVKLGNSEFRFGLIQTPTLSLKLSKETKETDTTYLLDDDDEFYYR